MKLFAITLALAIFTGSWDSVLTDEPVSKLKQLKQTFQEYVSDIHGGIEELAAMLNKSDLAHEIKDYVAETHLNVNRRIENLVGGLPTEVQQTLIAVFKIPKMLASEAFAAADKITEKTLGPVVSPYAKPVVDRVKTYADALRTGIQELNKNEKEKLKLKLKWDQLEAEAGPYIKNVLNQLREFREALQPSEDEVQERFTEKVASATNFLKPYLSPVVEKIREYASDWFDPFITL